MNDNTNPKLNQSKQIKLNDQKSKSIADTLAEDSDILTNYMLDDPDIVSLDDIREDSTDEIGQAYDADHHDPRTPPSLSDAQSISGHMPDPDVDDDIIDTAQQMGIGLDEDEENPQELNIADAVEQAERIHRDD